MKRGACFVRTKLSVISREGTPISSDIRFCVSAIFGAEFSPFFLSFFFSQSLDRRSPLRLSLSEIIVDCDEYIEVEKSSTTVFYLGKSDCRVKFRLYPVTDVRYAISNGGIYLSDILSDALCIYF